MERLLGNAFNFLEGALRQLKEDPKRSVIDFYTAVELFLKARLLAEHWSLIVSKEPDIEQFNRGDFVSVSFEEAHRRLKRVVGQPLPQEAIDAFDKVRKHRNRMVHFFHPDEAQQSREKIAFEQLAAWQHLNRLILGKWSGHFPGDCTLQASVIEQSLTAHRAYAEARFEHLRPKINALEAQGATFVQCPSCAMKAAQLDDRRDWIRHFDCLVCRNEWSEVPFDCPECDTPGVVEPYDGFKCQNMACQHAMGASDIYDALDDDPTTPDNYYEKETPANCDECQGYGTVCKHDDEYVCVNCLSVFEHVYACGWCGSFGTKRREHSEWTGCEHCDGRSGHVRDE